MKQMSGVEADSRYKPRRAAKAPCPVCVPDAESHLPSVTGREAVNILWALAKLGDRPGVSSGIGRGTAAEGPPSGSSNKCGSSSSASAATVGGSSGAGGGGVGGVRLLLGVCSRAEAVCSSLRSQEVANALWALGNLGELGVRGHQ